MTLTTGLQISEPTPDNLVLSPVKQSGLADQMKAGLDAPICLTWELTYACNLQCVHCLSSSGRRDPRELTTEECEAVIDELQRMQVFYINIGGGEPTIRKDFWHLVQYAVDHGVGVKFSTNGSGIDAAVAEQLAASDYVDVQISIDGADADKAHLEQQLGALRAENTQLRDELLVQITSSANASNEATRTLAEQTAAHLDEQRARLADLAVVATDAAEKATSAGEVDEATEARLAEIERLANEASAGAATATSVADDAAAAAAGADDRIGAVDARLTQVATELANQLSELSNELDAAAERRANDDDRGDAVADQAAVIDPELIDELLDAQDRLAAEQARYQIAFRQDLAELADRLRRQR